MKTIQKTINYYGGPLDGHFEPWSDDMPLEIDYTEGGIYKRLPIFKDKQYEEYADPYAWFPNGKLIQYGPHIIVAAYQDQSEVCDAS